MEHKFTDEIAELRSLVARHGSQYRLAKTLGVTPQLICQVLGRKKPVPPVLLRAMGLRKVVRYERIEQAMEAEIARL